MLLRHRSARSLARRARALSALVALGLGFAGCGESFTSCETTRTCATGTSSGAAPSGGTSTGGQSNGASGGARSGGAESTGGSETGGEDSSGGMGGLPFSCSLCDADTPVCLEDLEQCAECSPDNNPDPSEQGSGRGIGKSSPTQNPDCSPDTPVCSPDFECTQCLTDDHCTDDALPACTDEYTCAQCSQNSHCLDPAASSCDLDNNQCSPCTDNDDCAHLPDSPVCDSESGTCVQCSPLTEEDDCGTFSCDPATLTCTTTERNSLEPCEPCLADSECENPQNHLCVPLVWGSGDAKTERGGYCLQVFPNCDRPFLIEIKDRISLSGVSGESYCGINEALTTCDAVFALLKDHTCSDRENSSDCPDGGLCRTVGGSSSPRCTYECSGAASECLNPPTAGNTCGPGTTPDPVTPDYCGGKD